MATDEPSTPKRSGRKAETPAQRLERLQRDMQVAKQALKEHEQKTYAAIGAALVEEARARPELMTELRNIVAKRVGTKATAASVLELLDRGA